jgi:hypothetical protein
MYERFKRSTSIIHSASLPHLRQGPQLFGEVVSQELLQGAAEGVEVGGTTGIEGAGASSLGANRAAGNAAGAAGWRLEQQPRLGELSPVHEHGKGVGQKIKEQRWFR